jgi:hypothetical protein
MRFGQGRLEHTYLTLQFEHIKFAIFLQHRVVTIVVYLMSTFGINGTQSMHLFLTLNDEILSYLCIAFKF